MGADIIPEDKIEERFRGRYFFGTLFNRSRVIFDFIRMQHVFEHFTPEDGQKVLRNTFDILNLGGYLLITVPDLKVFIQRYRKKMLQYNWSFSDWAHIRIAKDALQSFYFSIFTHGVLDQSHQWCYDREVLEYHIYRSIDPAVVKFLSVFHPLASIPFTHNRRLEDLCVLIKKRN